MSSAISIFDIKNTNNNYNRSKVVYCGNCGEKNHIYKHCTQPIISLGIILFKYLRSTDTIKYLLVRRKDSIGYVEFIRGRYVSSDIKYIKRIISEMHQGELKKLLNKDFVTLWKNLWMNNDTNQYRKDFNKALHKFKKIKEGYKIGNEHISLKSLINENETNWKETEWGIPKGRRNLRETDLEAAEREFKEETSINDNDYTIFKNKKFIEEYTGSNNVVYKHIYFVSKYISSKNIILDPLNIEQKKEISGINFFTLEECREIIRPYYSEKIKLIENVENYLRSQRIYDLNSSFFTNLGNKFTLSKSI